MKIAVCGIGNRIRGDDGVGPEVIRTLRPDVADMDVLLLVMIVITDRVRWHSQLSGRPGPQWLAKPVDRWR